MGTKKSIKLWILLAALLFTFFGFSRQSQADTKRIYIAPDDHTDYMWSADENTYGSAFIEMIDYYLNLADQTEGEPPEYQSRWNCDGNFWMWTYEKNKSTSEFQRLINRIRTGHISVPLNPLAQALGGTPAEAVLRGMYYAGQIERRYNLRFPLANSVENQTLPYGLGALWAGSGAKYSWKGICGCNSKVPFSGEREYPIYWWTGMDGSRVLMKWYSMISNDSLGGYAEARNPSSAVDQADALCLSSDYPYSIAGAFGKGWDDLKTLTNEFVTVAKNKTTATRKVIVSNQLDFFQDFEAAYGAGLPSLSCSFGNEWELYVASMAEVSARVKRAVEKLRSAESLATLVGFVNPDFMAGRTAARDLAWMNMGLYWEHDWPADGPVSRSARANWQRRLAGEIENYVDSLYRDAADAFAGLIAKGGSNLRFYAFNPLSWQRTDFAEIPFAETNPVHVIDLSSGVETPSQIVTINGQRRLRVLAKDIPSVGYKVFEVRPGAGQSFSNAATISGNILENVFYKITVADRGAITSLIDKMRSNREFAKTINDRAINDLGPSAGTLQVENAGPVSVTLLASAPNPLNHTTRVTLFRDSRRIDIRNEIEQNFAGTYTWGYTFNLNSPDLWHEEVGAVIRAKLIADGGHYCPRNARYDWLSLNHFADMTGGGVGVTLSNADCYFAKLGNSSTTSLDVNTPQILPLVGGQVDGTSLGISNQGGDAEFLQRFALQTHDAFDEAEAMRFALEHQNPLVTGILTGGNAYPENTFSFLMVSNPNALVWALKPSEGGIAQGFIVRVWNFSSMPVNVSLTFSRSLTGAKRTTHLETDLESAAFSGTALSIPLAQKQIQTFRVEADITTPPTPIPTTDSLSPSSAASGGGGFTLTVNGSSFVSGSTVQWNGSGRATTFVSTSQLTASILNTDIATPGTAEVTVFNPAPGGGTSNAQTFTINASPNPVPTTASLSPSSAASGGAGFTLTVNGGSFVSGSTVQWNGSARATTFVTTSQLTASILSTDIATPGTVQVTVFNPAPGGGTSNAQTFSISNNPPTTVTFDSPVPTGSSGSLLNGLFQGIQFGTGQWRWEGAWLVDNTNHIYFDSATGTSRIFTFSPGPRVLTSLRVFTRVAGTLTLTDDLGQTKTQTITTGSIQLVTSGWAQASTTITVSYTAGWELGVDDITYSPVSAPDTTLPTISMTAPAGGSTVSKTINVSASASDNVGVVGVQFLLNGANLDAEVLSAPYVISWDTTAVTNGSHTLSARARDASNNAATAVSVTVTVSNGGPPDASQVGQWAGPYDWPMAPVHMALLRTGQVLIWDKVGGGGAAAQLWNPAMGTFTAVPVDKNIFGSGHAFLADGRLLIDGGTGSGDFNGIPDVNIFDPATQSWVTAAPMSLARCYPTAITLPDGRVLTVTGEIVPGSKADTPEIYDPLANAWVQLTNAQLTLPLYPHLFLLPDGGVLNAGSEEAAMVTRVLDVGAQTWTTVGANVLDGSSAVTYLPGEIMKSGTQGDVDLPSVPAAGTTYVLDMTQPSPAWKQTASMTYPRAHHNLTILPDGMVLVVGGGGTSEGGNVSQAVYAAELWNPATQTWTTMASMQRPRLYQSTALLLPDGRILSAGGYWSPYVEPTAEIYSPPYLFKGPRPTIVSVPTAIQHGSSFFVGTPDAASIAMVSLVRPGDVTHQVNMDQRFLPLSFQQSSGGLLVQAPADANLAPPGYYMLFLVDASGIPSVASFVAFPPSGSRASALRFWGNGVNDIDRVKIRVDDPTSTLPAPPVNIGATDFTIELWMRGNAAENAAGSVQCGVNNNWIYGNILIDRDRYNQDRKFGLSVAGGRLVWGVTGAGLSNQLTICGPTPVLDGQWHHVAVQRRVADGQMWLFVDGRLEAQALGPVGDISYPYHATPLSLCGPSGNQPCTDSDPFLVIGAEKHGDGAQFPSFSGWVTEVRLSNTLRYTDNFVPSVQRFISDANTVGLYHFDEGTGDVIRDSSGAPGGPSPGLRKYGGSNPPGLGPAWDNNVPFGGDTIPPVVSLTSPSPGTVSGTVMVAAEASDNVGVVGVQFQLDGVNLGGEVTSSPFSISWDTTTVTNGSHTLTAVARDAAGNRATSSSVAVTVANNPEPTTISISPNVAVAGGAAFTLTVNGSGFVSMSTVNWNGAGRATTFVSATQLRASISASDIAKAGTAQVTVVNPTPGGGTSNAQTFTISASTSMTVNFDSPGPPGSSGSLLNGIFQGINFGTGQWRWEGAYASDPTNHIYFASSSGRSRSFTFSPAPRVLVSMRVFTDVAGTLTLTDNLGQTWTQAVTVGSMQLVAPGWTKASTTITVRFTVGWSLGVDDITYRTP